jgi:hypothetical protein
VLPKGLTRRGAVHVGESTPRRRRAEVAFS